MPDLAIIRSESREGPWARLGASVVAAACLALVVIAGRLQPTAAGHGTHTQLGLPECGFAMAFNKPCFTCGMTTAFAHAASGRLDRAFMTQPAGTVLALGAATVFWIGLHTAVTGSRAAPAMIAGVNARHAFGLVGLILVGWVWLLVRFDRGGV